MVAAGTNDREVRARKVDVVHQLGIGGVVTLIHQIGEPDKLVGSLNLIVTVHQRGHAGINLAADDTDAVHILMVGDILSLGVRIGKLRTVGTLTCAVQVACGIDLKAVREGNGCGISTQRLPPCDDGLVAVHHVAKLTRSHLLFSDLLASVIWSCPVIHIIAIAHGH